MAALSLVASPFLIIHLESNENNIRSQVSDVPAHPLCPTVRIWLQNVVEIIRPLSGWRLPGPSKIIRLQDKDNKWSINVFNNALMDLSKQRPVIWQMTCFRRAQRASEGCDSHQRIHRASSMQLGQRETFWGLRWPQSTNDGLSGVVSCPQQRDIAAICEPMDNFTLRLHVP